MTETTTKIKIAELIEDFDLYPRSNIDSAHVANLAHALEAGEELPAIIIDERSKRIIDGFHRRRALLRILGDQAEIEVEARKYPSEKDMYIDAMRHNARHGKAITGSEQTGAILKAQRLHVSVDMIASSLGLTQERVQTIIQTKVGTIRYARGPANEKIALKRSVHHLKSLTREQADAMDMFPGQPQVLLLRQLNKLIETDCIETENSQVIAELKRLRDALNEMELE